MKHRRPPLHLPLLLALLVLVLAAPVTADSDPPAERAEPWLDDLGRAVELARERDAYILVDLYADWCGWCKVLEDEVFSTPRFQRMVREHGFVLLRVDTEDGAEGAALQARYQAHSLPTTLILDADLVRVGKIGGFAPTEQFIEYVEAQIAAWHTIVEHFEQVAASDDVELQRNLAKDLHERGDGARAARLYERVLSRVEPATEAAAWLHYLAADAHRLARDFDRARRALDRALAVLPRAETPADLRESLDFLAFQIAQDDGDCRKAKLSLEKFLQSHPASQLRRQAKGTLEALERGEGACA